MKRRLCDTQLSIQITPFSWALHYDRFIAGVTICVGPIGVTLIWPQSLRLNYED